jgi:hypothetical protein
LYRRVRPVVEAFLNRRAMMPKSALALAALLRERLPPGVQVVAMAVAPPARMRFRLYVPVGVDPFVAQAALQSVLAEAVAGTPFEIGPSRARIVDAATPFRPPDAEAGAPTARPPPRRRTRG